MKLNNLEFLETLKQNSQVCGGDNNSDFNADVDVVIDVDLDIDIELELDSADVVISESLGQLEFGAFFPVGFDPSSEYHITVVGWDGEEVLGSLSAAIG